MLSQILFWQSVCPMTGLPAFFYFFCNELGQKSVYRSGEYVAETAGIRVHDRPMNFDKLFHRLLAQLVRIGKSIAHVKIL